LLLFLSAHAGNDVAEHGQPIATVAAIFSGTM
jgi:hypothetical protein